jgi:hypothetical protein
LCFVSFSLSLFFLFLHLLKLPTFPKSTDQH